MRIDTRVRGIMAIMVFFLASWGSAFAEYPTPPKPGNLELSGGVVIAVDRPASTITVESDGRNYIFDVAGKYLREAEKGLEIRYIRYRDDDGKLFATKLKWGVK